MLFAALFGEHFYVRQSPYARGNKAILCVLQLWLTCSSIQRWLGRWIGRGCKWVGRSRLAQSKAKKRTKKNKMREKIWFTAVSHIVFGIIFPLPSAACPTARSQFLVGRHDIFFALMPFSKSFVLLSYITYFPISSFSSGYPWVSVAVALFIGVGSWHASISLRCHSISKFIYLNRCKHLDHHPHTHESQWIIPLLLRHRFFLFFFFFSLSYWMRGHTQAVAGTYLYICFIKHRAMRRYRTDFKRNNVGFRRGGGRLWNGTRFDWQQRLILILIRSPTGINSLPYRFRFGLLRCGAVCVWMRECVFLVGIAAQWKYEYSELIKIYCYYYGIEALVNFFPFQRCKAPVRMPYATPRGCTSLFVCFARSTRTIFPRSDIILLDECNNRFVHRCVCANLVGG